MPRQVKDMVQAIQDNRWEAARQLHLDLLDAHQAMFIESNPVPVKTSASLMGKCRAAVRLPLVAMQTDTLARLQTVLRKHELI